ncbi:MAG: amidohydrolase family protein [Dehalococcoidia bacterium]
MADIQRAIRERAATTPSGDWVRASGYEETRLAEGRHPTAADLDAVAPDHPVRLIHSSGHTRVLNTLALRLAGIEAATEEPPGGVIERDPTTGAPNGVLVGMEAVVDRAVPRMSYEELSAAVREASDRLLRAGVTLIQDATYTNGRSEWELFERLIADGALDLDVVMMEGVDHRGALPEAGANGRLRRGAVKVMLHELEHTAPDGAEIAAMRAAVRAAHEAGRQVAVHAVGEDAVIAAVEAIEAALAAAPRSEHRHRIEHCSLLTEGVAARIARSGIVAVCQPSFVYERGDRYLRLVSEERRRGLHAFRTLRDAGVMLAAGSDAPVTPPPPLASVAAAVDRATKDGDTLGPEQAVDVEDALHWWTSGAARAAFLEGERGSLRPGLRADLVLLPSGALEASPAELRAMQPEGVWREGRRVRPTP